jgi:hypothetical protein
VYYCTPMDVVRDGFGVHNRLLWVPLTAVNADANRPAILKSAMILLVLSLEIVRPPINPRQG